MNADEARQILAIGAEDDAEYEDWYNFVAIKQLPSGDEVIFKRNMDYYLDRTTTPVTLPYKDEVTDLIMYIWTKEILLGRFNNPVRDRILYFHPLTGVQLDYDGCGMKAC